MLSVEVGSVSVAPFPKLSALSDSDYISETASDDVRRIDDWARSGPVIPFEIPQWFTPPAEEDDGNHDSVQFVAPLTWDFKNGVPLHFDVHYMQRTLGADGGPLTSSVVWRYRLDLSSLDLNDPLSTKGKVEVVDKFTFPPSPIPYSVVGHADGRRIVQDVLPRLSKSAGASMEDSELPGALLAEYSIEERADDAENAGVGEQMREALITTILLNPGTPQRVQSCSFSGRVVQATISPRDEESDTDEADSDDDHTGPHETVYSNLVLYNFLNE